MIAFTTNWHSDLCKVLFTADEHFMATCFPSAGHVKKRETEREIVYRVGCIAVVSVVLTLWKGSKLKVKQQFAAQWLRREIN
jgi:hypothetical protein